MRARVKSPMTPPAAPLTPSIPPDPGMCWARLREAFPAVASPTAKEKGTDRNEFLAVALSVLLVLELQPRSGDAI